MTEIELKRWESRTRRRLAVEGLKLVKSRCRTPDHWWFGLYGVTSVTDGPRGSSLTGGCTLSQSDMDDFIADRERSPEATA